MTIDKAIERLSIMLDMREKRGYHAEMGAIKLGIEALKLCKKYRGQGLACHQLPLPGETQE